VHHVGSIYKRLVKVLRGAT